MIRTAADRAIAYTRSNVRMLRALRGSLGRLPATRINAAATSERTVTGAAAGESIPIAFGRVELPGLIFAAGHISGDLVVGVAWCIGEIDAVEAIYINDAAVPGSVTVSHVLGTPTQTAHATLQAAITAYADTMRIATPTGWRGIAYTVLRIPTGAIDGFPRVRGIVRGLKVYDPRTDTTSYSANPALHMGTLITDPVIGIGVPCYGLVDAADWCDEYYQGTAIPRARLGLALSQGRSIYPDWLDLLAEYAECWYALDGDGVRLIPDRPVDLEATPVVGPSGIIDGTLAVRAESSLDSPTEVELRYLAPTDDHEPWRMDTVTHALPGVAEGEIPRIPTSISMEGVQRIEEAAVKAMARLYRARHRVSVGWVTTDPGIAYQRGDVVRIDHPARGVAIPVRITSVTLAAPGRYAVESHVYDISHYPDSIELPDATTTVPVGVITLLAGSTVPDGWAAWTDANGRYLRMVDSGLAPGDTGGTASYSRSGSTTTTGAHNGPRDRLRPVCGGPGGPLFGHLPHNDSVGGHSHSWSLSGSFTARRQRNRLVIKTGSAGALIPPQCRVLGLAGLLVAGVSRITSFSDRLLYPDTTNTSDGSFSHSAGLTTGSADDSHQHHGIPISGCGFTGHDASTTVYQFRPGGGPHTHTSTPTVTISPRRHTLALYGSDGDYAVVPGMMFLWAGDPETLPADWYLCDGDHGTPDLSGRFLSLAGPGELQSIGNNQASLSGGTSSRSHDHVHSTHVVSGGIENVAHGMHFPHSHSISQSWSQVLPYYIVAVIMYAPQS